MGCPLQLLHQLLPPALPLLLLSRCASGAAVAATVALLLLSRLRPNATIAAAAVKHAQLSAYVAFDAGVGQPC